MSSPERGMSSGAPSPISASSSNDTANSTAGVPSQTSIHNSTFGSRSRKRADLFAANSAP